MTIRWHAVLLDETGCEFGHTFDAKDRAEAWDEVADMFPESRCIQLESPQDTADRVARTRRHIMAQMDGDLPEDWGPEDGY